MYKEGDIVRYKNYKNVRIVGIIIPNTIFEIKDMKSNKVLEVSYKDLKNLEDE